MTPFEVAQKGAQILMLVLCGVIFVRTLYQLFSKQRSAAGWAGLFITAAVILGAMACLIDAGPVAGALTGARVATATPVLPPTWDPRLTALGVQYIPEDDCTAGCWRLVAATYRNEQESQGLHHAWLKAFWVNGEQLPGVPWWVRWESGQARIETKAAPDYADYPLWDCYFPDQGERGGYSVDMGSRSDRVTGLGLPYCVHVSFYFDYEWEPGGSPTPAPTPTRAATPTPSATPCATCRRLYLPIIEK